MARTRLAVAFGIGLGLMAASQAEGGGIAVPMQDATAAAQGDAFIAEANNPSALYYNPAGITQLTGTNVSGGAIYFQPDFHLHSDDGQDQHSQLPTYLPDVYAETDFGLKDWRFGLAVNDLFGLSENYGTTGPLRNIETTAQLAVINIAPAAAYQLTNQLSVGLAANIYYGDLDYQHLVPLGAPPTPEGTAHLHGSGYAAGVTPGFLWKIDDRNSLAGYYKSPFSIDFNGHARLLEGRKTIVGPAPTDASLDFPQSFGLGYAVRPVKPLKLELDVDWTDWHSVDELAISSPNRDFNGQNVPADWKSGFTYRLGLDYALTPQWSLRAGYAYSQGSTPEATFSPLVPDSDYNLFAAGVGYHNKRWGIDVCGEYILRNRHDVVASVDSPAVDGTWDNGILGILATLSIHL